jgi:hypothetical protein
MHASNFRNLDETNVRSEFVVTGDWFSPEEFTQELQVIPDRICKKGEKIHGDKTWEFNRWEIFTEYEESCDINEQLGEILCRLNDKRELLIKLKEKMDLDYVFDFVVNIKNHEVPAIYFEQEFIDFCGDIGADIDVDTYVY